MAKALAIDDFGPAISAAVGPRLVALVLYGSAARGTDARSADTLLIVDRVDESLFSALEPVVARWTAAGHPVPLVFSQAEWGQSADAFAVEYTDIRAASRLLAGRDPWDGVRVNPADLRRQLEHELRGKVIRLRQGYLAARGNGRRLGLVVRESASGVLAMLRALLRLTGRAVPAEAAAAVREAGAVAGIDGRSAAALIEEAGSGKVNASRHDGRVAAYLEFVGRIAEYVNGMQ